MDISLWDPIKLSNKGPQLSHLFYVDDLTLMAHANEKTINTIHLALNSFCSLSGHKITITKSKILFQNAA